MLHAERRLSQRRHIMYHIVDGMLPIIKKLANCF